MNADFLTKRKRLLRIGAILTVVACAAVYFFTFPVLKNVLKVPDATLPHVSEVSPILDKSGQFRIPLRLVSDKMQNALLVEEDRRFYLHHGIDILGEIRAIGTNLKAGKPVQGGSTITEQLAKNVFLDWRQKTALRKVQQMVLAWDLENRYSKEQILEAYLNEVYFGNGAYGVETAARRYFDVQAKDLDLGESAFLAGLVQAPSELGAAAGRRRALQRQKEILQKLQDNGVLKAVDVEEISKRKLPLKL